MKLYIVSEIGYDGIDYSELKISDKIIEDFKEEIINAEEYNNCLYIEVEEIKEIDGYRVKLIKI